MHSDWEDRLNIYSWWKTLRHYSLSDCELETICTVYYVTREQAETESLRDYTCTKES